MKKAAKVYMQKIESIVAEKDVDSAKGNHHSLAKRELICTGRQSQK